MLSGQGVHIHVFHKGVDVTARCIFADDTDGGMAVLFLSDAKGRKYIGRRMNMAAKETVYGVTLVEGAPFGK